MSGLGTMAHAARHLGMFAATASYSGLLHIRHSGDPIAGPEIIRSLLRDFGQDPDALEVTQSKGMVGPIIGVLGRVGTSRPAGHPMWLTMLI